LRFCIEKERNSSLRKHGLNTWQKRICTSRAQQSANREKRKYAFPPPSLPPSIPPQSAWRGRRERGAGRRKHGARSPASSPAPPLGAALLHCLRLPALPSPPTLFARAAELVADSLPLSLPPSLPPSPPSGLPLAARPLGGDMRRGRGSCRASQPTCRCAAERVAASHPPTLPPSPSCRDLPCPALPCPPSLLPCPPCPGLPSSLSSSPPLPSILLPSESLPPRACGAGRDDHAARRMRTRG